MDGPLHSEAGLRGLSFFLLMALLALVNPGCSTYIGTTSKSFLRQVRSNPDPNIRYIAYAKLGSPGAYEDDRQKAEAVETLIAKFEEGKEPIAIRAVIVRTLGSLGDPRARRVAIKAANDPEPVIRLEGCRALGKLGRSEDATILARIMTVDALEDCRISAIEGLGALKSEDPRIYKVLLDGMDHEDPAIRLECLSALRKITRKDLGVDPSAWRRYLEPVLEPKAPQSTTAANSSRGEVKAGRGATPKLQ
jgi:hypothetical protein